MRPRGVSNTGMVDPSPNPQISRSPTVGISLQCLPICAVKSAAVALNAADDGEHAGVGRRRRNRPHS